MTPSRGLVAAAESNRLFRLIFTDERTGAPGRISPDLRTQDQKSTTDATVFQLPNSTKSSAPSALTIPPYASNLDRSVRFACIDCRKETSPRHHTSRHLIPLGILNPLNGMESADALLGLNLPLHLIFHQAKATSHDGPPTIQPRNYGTW